MNFILVELEDGECIGIGKTAVDAIKAFEKEYDVSEYKDSKLALYKKEADYTVRVGVVRK